MANVDLEGMRSELSKELRTARGWILGVGAFMFIMDMVFIHGVYADDLPSAWKNRLTIISGVIFAVFIGLFFFAKHQPKLACILALVAFWGLQLYNASQDPDSLTKGVVIKVLFTLALVKGIKSGGRAEELRGEIAKVFE